jgi:hypothetical protein
MTKNPERGWSRRFSLDGRLELLRQQVQKMFAAPVVDRTEVDRLAAEITRLECLVQTRAA